MSTFVCELLSIEMSVGIPHASTISRKSLSASSDYLSASNLSDTWDSFCQVPYRRESEKLYILLADVHLHFHVRVVSVAMLTI